MSALLMYDKTGFLPKEIGFVLAPFRVVNSARKSQFIIVRFLIHAKAPDRKASELTSRVNSSIFALSTIGFVLALNWVKLGLFLALLALNWVCFGFVFWPEPADKTL